MFNKFTTAGISHPAQGSAEFDGASDYITTPINGSDFPIDTFSISAWVYSTQNTGYKSVAGIDASESISRGSFYFQNSIGYWTLSVVNTANVAVSASQSTIFNANQWYHLTGTFDGSNIKLYVDGSLEDTTAFTGTLTTPTGDMLIGAAYFNNAIGDYWPGNLANVAIWNRALSSDEINSVMWKSIDSLTASESNGLQAWYSLDDIDGTNVPDSSGNGNNGTAN